MNFDSNLRMCLLCMVALVCSAATIGCQEGSNNDVAVQSNADLEPAQIPETAGNDGAPTRRSPVSSSLNDDSSTEQQKSNEIANDASAQENQQEELPSLADVRENPKGPDDDLIEETEDVPPEVQTIEIPETWKRIGEEHEIWVDFTNKEVIAAGNICLTAGPLEVFACPRRTKEHEAIVSANCRSSQLHALLLAIGAEPGSPVQWHEEYTAATGPIIKITVMWQTDNGIKKIPAQELVTNIKTGKPMESDWVFGGSQTFVDEESGETYYYGDSGEMVCLSNFSTATLDVPVKSSDANEGLLFEANSKNIPEIHTKVYLVFQPVFD